MVVTLLPATSDTWVWQENARLPSTWTMQAPHRPVPHPYFVPVSFSPSRITHNSGVCGGASVDAGFPFTLNWIVMLALPVAVGCLGALMVPVTPAVSRAVPGPWGGAPWRCANQRSTLE